MLHSKFSEIFNSQMYVTIWRTRNCILSYRIHSKNTAKNSITTAEIRQRGKNLEYDKPLMLSIFFESLENCLEI